MIMREYLLTITYPYISLSRVGVSTYKCNHKDDHYHRSWCACSMIRDTWSGVNVVCHRDQSNQSLLPITRYVPSSRLWQELTETIRRSELLIPFAHSFTFSNHSSLVRGSFVWLYSLARSSRWSVVFTYFCPPFNCIF